MNDLLLSICIPTYNRSEFIGDCLDSIVSQFDNKEVFDQIEVVISDNASMDDTENVVKTYVNKYSNIKYFRNETNIGFDKNILNAVEKSNGIYCLPIGDDDGFLPESLTYIIGKIKSQQTNYFMINGWGYDHELKNPVASHPNRQIKNDVQYKDLKEFVESIGNYTDLVGNFGSMSHIFKREIWNSFNEKEKFIGTQTIHLYIILSVFKTSPFTILAKPIIKTRNDNMRWDTFPGLEKHTIRGLATAKGVMWISNLYNLSLSNTKVMLYFLTRAYWISLKEFVKRVLSILGLRKI